MKKILSSGILYFAPLVALAQASGFTGIRGYLFSIREIVNLLIIIAGGIALLVFFWGLAMFIRNTDSDKGRQEGRSLMIWGVVALFVMITVGGLIAFIQEETGLGPRSLNFSAVIDGGCDSGGSGEDC